MAVKDFKVKNGIITGGSVLPDSGESYDLGSSTKKFKDIHLSGTLTGDVTGTVSSIANHTTANLSEGSNLYYTDARVSTLIDSAYIAARTSAGTDSAAILNLIDSAYIRSRQIEGLDSALADGFLMTSAETITLIDSAYIAARSAAGTDSAAVTGMIDSAYITARSGIGIINAGFKDFKYIADSGQTVISGNDASSQTLAFDSNNFQVFINGIRLLGSDFTANHSANTITLTEAAADSDEIIVSTVTSGAATTIIDKSYIAARLPAANALNGLSTFSYSSDSNQTIYTGNSIEGTDLSYSVGNISVFMNGVLLSDSDDYVATNGTHLTLNGVPATGSEVTVQALNVSTVSQPVWSLVSSTPYNAAAGDQLVVDTSSQAITVNLPSGAAFGNQVRIVDGSGTSATNNIIISRSGKKIQGTDSDLTIDVNEAAFGLVYFNTARGWVLIDK